MTLTLPLYSIIVGGNKVIKILIPTVISFKIKSVIPTENNKFLRVNGSENDEANIKLMKIFFFSNMKPIIAITSIIYKSSLSNANVRF